MTIILNGAETTINVTRLDEVLTALGFKGAVVATAVNSSFVRRDLRAETHLKEGDRLEVIAPMQGG